MKIPLTKPEPDIEHFKNVILRKEKPKRVNFIELHIDQEIIKHVSESLLNREWVEPSSSKDRKAQESCLRNVIEFHYRLGYDALRLPSALRFSSALSFTTKVREGEDTAALTRNERRWVEEGKGIISSWEDFENYPWPSPEKMDLWVFEFLSENLPEGMGFWASFCPGVFEIAMNELMGLETLSYLLYDNAELVEAVFNKSGDLILGAYKRVVGLDNLAGFFQGDDMGFKTSTLVSSDVLKKYVLPWHKKFAEFAHEHGLVYILHSCGNVDSIMEDLIEDVKIDAKHSFEDAIMPVTEFKKKYGDRIAVLGGVDLDKLCRLEEKELRGYVRNILDECMPGGGYALGSGNSVANYTPVNNFLAMLDEGLRDW